MNFATLADALAARRTSRQTVCYIEGASNERTLPLGDIYGRALGLLRHFQARGAGSGDEMILLVERNEQFIDAFWACILGNIVAVPLAPGNTDEHRLKFFRVLAKLQRPHLCTDQKIFARLAGFADANGLTDEIERIRPATVFMNQVDDISQPGRLHPAKPDDTAFVQYSSGSTSMPKGVCLTHRNLLTNIAAIAHGAHLGAQDSGLSWMPLTHDMGLIGFHLTLVLTDITHCLMSTALFVRRPQLWLAIASKKRSTLLCSPNFGYRHFLKTFDASKSEALDLSHVRLLFNGAEPISADLCREFLDTLRPHGLQQGAMFPVYGLAEASLAVTFPKPGSGYDTITLARGALMVGQPVQLTNPYAAHAMTMVQVGRPVLGCEVRITHDNYALLAGNTIGHVQIRGDNVSRGYYQDPQATRAAIDADRWLDTGDLGFLSDGVLTITGRAKDILFVSGQNYYPNDIEAVIEKNTRIEPGKIAVSGVRADHDSTDEVLVFVLHRGDLAEFANVAKNVVKCVGEHIGIVVNHVIPVSRIPKTTSGKIQRYLLADAYLKGEYNKAINNLVALASENPAVAYGARTEIEKNLKESCDAFIDKGPIGVHDNIFELGTSSLMLAQIYQRIETIYPGQLEVTDFFDYPTIAELAGYLEKRLAQA